MKRHARTAPFGSQSDAEPPAYAAKPSVTENSVTAPIVSPARGVNRTSLSGRA